MNFVHVRFAIQQKYPRHPARTKQTAAPPAIQQAGQRILKPFFKKQWQSIL
jgi:hypothetical protein